MSNDLLTRIEANKERIDAYRPMQEPLLSELRAYYRIGLTWSSNALEGNSLTESETKVVLEDGLTVAGKPLREYYEATGHAKAYDAMWTLIDAAKPIREDDIRRLHELFYSQVDVEVAGAYRLQRVFITGSHFTPTVPEKIPGEMAEFAAWLEEAEKIIHPVELAAQAHKRFVFIHPFVDGNGRVARLLMNLCLLRHGYTLAVIPPVLRVEYIQLLEKAHTNDADFVVFIMDRVLETQKDILRMLS